MAMIKRHFSHRWLLWLLLLMQGCTSSPSFRSNVAITLENGQRVTLCFETIVYDSAMYFRDFLEKLERGDKEAIANINSINKPYEFGSTRLGEAIDYALRGSYAIYFKDENLYAVRFLLEKGADPDIGIDELCTSLGSSGATGKRGLVLLLSYGARLGVKHKIISPWCPPKRSKVTTLKQLDKNAPWISEKLRKEYYEEAKKKLPPKIKEAYLPTYKIPPAAIAAERAAEALRKSAWKTAISPADQAALKKEYFTDIAKQLINSPQRNGTCLDKAFVQYIKSAGVAPSLVKELEIRT